MDSSIPIPVNIPRGAPLPPMGQGFPPQMLQAGVMRPPYFPISNTNPIEASL